MAVIRAIEVTAIDLPLLRPINLGGRLKLETAEGVVVRLETGDGLVGWGESAASPNLSGEISEGMVAAIRRFLAPLLIGGSLDRLGALRPMLERAIVGNPAAKAAVDLALLDLAGRSAGKPVCELLGGARRRQMPVMRMLGNATIDQDVAEADAARREGTSVFKLKVGTRSLEDDVAAARAVRAIIGAEAKLSVDANTTWSEDTARDFARATGTLRLAYVEQPLKADDLAGMACLAEVFAAPLCADEGMGRLADIEAHHKAGAARGASLKPIKLGGYIATKAAAERCTALGWHVNLAAKIAESSLATAGLLHLAAAVPALDWDLTTTNHYLAADIVKQPLAVENGVLTLPEGPGLGVEVDPAKVAEFRRR